MTGIRAVVSLSSLFAVLQLGGTAFAQPAADDATPAVQARPNRVTEEQLKAFAELTGDSPRSISLRMSRDVNLGPLIVSAADAQKSRKRVGLAMTIAGFTVLGVGNAVGAVIMVTTPGYPDVKGHEGQFWGGAAIAGGATLVGLLVGIPGIIKMATTGEEENAALEYYAPTRSQDVSLRQAMPGLAPRAITVPLLAGVF
jgi:hypothetical protein